MNKITSKMKSKIFTLVNPIVSFAKVSTGMTGKFCFFGGNGGGERPGLTYFPDFAPMSFGELMVLVIGWMWIAYLFHFLA